MARGSGSLGTIEFLAPADVEAGANKLNVFNDALAQLKSLGIDAPASALGAFRGEMPIDLTELDDNRLGSLLSHLSVYCGYVEIELAKAQSLLDIAKERYEFFYSRIRIGIKAAGFETKMTDRDKTDLVLTDPRIVEAKAQILYHDAVYRLTRNIRDQVQRNWDTVSRRITQRGQEVERMKRESNIAGIPTGARQFRRPGSP